MLDRVDFSVTRQAPTLDHYRREWTPGPDVTLGGVWVGAVVSDQAGRNYLGLRGTDDFVTGMTHVVSPVCGFRALHPGAEATHLFSEYSGIDWFEPLTYTDSGDRLQTSYPSGRFEWDDDGFHWYDAGNRWELHGRTVSDVAITHVPIQPGIEHQVHYRHELMYATGIIDGVEVSGYAHQDFAYGPPGMIYTELPVARHLQGMWMSWLHAYPDGRLGGGSFWQGRDGLDFGPGYLLEDGVTTVHRDIVATPTFDENGKMTALEATVGAASYNFAFDTSGSPLHYFGRVVSDGAGTAPARSWCWVEYAGGMLTPELLDMMNQQFRLVRGR
ncbi:hypothetical protein MCHIJ_37070 [Mycolicibacterium chitae]|uniref:Uncharacterized protein n=1 Tax=Mycolicibacterium chitae TaxID=1792 RepID=A0A3S4S987_MYCCI|nr:hypothetical protein [Mycolicibacterium chitae]MCV7107506.1 hypothetical protein [Mycolicibacterium chitae]BBZ04270.1 hypothetical protein MCHIJ_37070 [Mycolicibacterium chitae]VEG47911.1 Uncharacterised protein [Mycolicibacterium chitae]